MAFFKQNQHMHMKKVSNTAKVVITIDSKLLKSNSAVFLVYLYVRDSKKSTILKQSLQTATAESSYEVEIDTPGDLYISIEPDADGYTKEVNSVMDLVTTKLTVTQDNITNKSTLYQQITADINGYPWGTATDSQITSMLKAHNYRLINLMDYWNVGDTRLLHLKAINKLSGYESEFSFEQPEQDIELVILGKPTFTMGISLRSYGYRDYPALVARMLLGMKDCFSSKLSLMPANIAPVGDYEDINSSTLVNSFKDIQGKYGLSAYTPYCLVIEAMPDYIKPFFIPFNKPFSRYNVNTKLLENTTASNSSTNTGYAWMPNGYEISGTKPEIENTGNPDSTWFKTDSQLPYYATAANRKKKLGKDGNAASYWTCSIRTPTNSNAFCNYHNINASGNISSTAPATQLGITLEFVI